MGGIRRVIGIGLLLGCTALCACAADDDAAAGDDVDAGSMTATPKHADASVRPSKPASDAGSMTAPGELEVPSEPRAFMADVGDGWRSLIEGEWEIPKGSEGYRCVRFTLPEDVYVHAFRPLIPLGTHHTVLTIGDPSEPDGVSECTAEVNAPSGVFGSGVGTEAFTYPDGIAVHLRAGQQLVLNLHLFNSSEQDLHGISGTLIKTIPEDQVEHVAEGVLAGPVTLNIPPGDPVVQSGQCTMNHDVTIVAVIPHMHTLGVHLKAVAESSIDGEVVLHDGPYDFDSQIVYPVDPVQMKKGDIVRVDCTYENHTDHVVHFGESTLDEMCFAGLFRYPEGGPFVCTN